MRTGYTISVIGHALVLGWGLVSFSAKPFDVSPTDSVMADVISETEFNNLTAGVKTAKQVAKPVPVVDKIGEVKEPPKDPVQKVIDKPEVQMSAAQPPAPQPPDIKPPEQKPPEAKPPEPPPYPPPPAGEGRVGAAQPAAADPKPEPDPIAEALRRDEARQKEEARKLEEARKREEAKKREEARKREEAKKREEVKSDLDRIETALLDKRAPQRQAVTGTMINPTPSLGSTTGNAPQLSQNEIAMLRAQLYSCWNPPVGVVEAKDLVVTVRFSLNRDGSLASEPMVVNRGRNALFQIAAEAATRAVRRCQPFRLPVSKYEAWQDVEVNFDPSEMFRG
jgi:outer membrane biosynthesis protein TonB